MKKRFDNLGLLFNEISTFYADTIAIRTIYGATYKYNNLETVSNQYAHFLLAKGIVQNDVVAILNNKTISSYALMIACLKIGAIYTNLDPNSPEERLSKMLDICFPKILFYGGDESTCLDDYDCDIEIVDFVSSSFKNSVNTFKISLPECTNNVGGNTTAYIMFTSGSTGFPKGAAISHKNVINFIEWSQSTYKTNQYDIFTNLNPMHFDNSVFDFYSSLFTGASIIPINENLKRNPRKLLDALNDLNPTIWFSVPSMLVYTLNMRALRSSDLSTLKIVTFGGEGFPKNQLRKLWSYWGKRIRFVNVYGPTECTCICSSYDVTEQDIDSDELLPLGHMAANFYGIVVDDEGNKLPAGEIGELHIGGHNVGKGYYNNPEKTNEVFVTNTNINKHKEIVYRSGDLVKQDPETKMFLFCGRKDNQIKRMGYRIELEEIENAINSIDFINENAVIYEDNEKFNSKIIACVSSTLEHSDKITEILKKYLPSYMLPDLFFYFDRLPKNQNGKIDRLKLKKEVN